MTEQESERKKNRRSLMALLGGVAGFGIAQKASAQQPSTLTNMPYASTPLGGGELTYVVQGGISKKTPISSITGAALPGGSSGQLQFNNAGAFGGYGVGSGLSVVGGNLTATAATGMAVVPSVTALAALSTATGSTYLTDPIRGGNVFIWNTGSYTIQVANDPGQGIYVATATDPTGASGAWVRQWAGRASIGWFGAVGDAVITFPVPWAPPTITSGTDNSGALANWGTWARHQSSLGIPVVMETPPPTGNGYLFAYANCHNFAVGIKRLTWHNGGALWQSTTASDWPWSVLALPIATLGPTVYHSYVINQTAVGAFGFSMVNITDVIVPAASIVSGSTYTIYSVGTTNWNSIGVPAAVTPAVGVTFVANSTTPTGTGSANPGGFSVGNWVALTSLDIQYFGYPPNPQWNEFVRISFITQYAAATVSTAAYANNTGLLTLTFASNPFAGAPNGSFFYLWFPGINVAVSGLTGSGVSSLNANWPIASVSSNGLTVVLQTVTGLGTLTITGGTLAAVAVVTTEQNLRYQHRTDYPDTTMEGPPTVHLGPARVYLLDTGPWTINGIVYPLITWDIDHWWDSMTIGAVNNGAGGGQYANWVGKKLLDTNWVGPAFSESIAGQVYHKQPTLFFPGEPDKMVELIDYDGLQFYNGGAGNVLGPQGTMGFQSASIDRVVIRNSKISSSLALGPTKNFLVDNCDVAAIGVDSTNLGFSNSQVIQNSRVFGIFGGALTAVNGAQLSTIDNSTTAFYGTAGPGAGSVAGVITLVLSQFSLGAITAWCAIPGMTVCLAGPSSVLTASDLNTVRGDGVVWRIYEDANGLYVYIVTSLTFATLPSWVPTTNNIYLFRNSGAKFKDVTGCDAVRQASEAYETKSPTGRRLDYWNLYTIDLGGAYAASLTYSSLFYGNLYQVIIDIESNGSAAGAFITIGMAVANSNSSFAFASGGMLIKCVVGIGAQRVITQNTTTTTGLQTGDSVTVGGTPQSPVTLPTGYVVGGFNGASQSITTTGATLGNTTSPIVRVSLYFDTGRIRKAYLTNFDVSGRTNDAAFATIGLLP